MVGKKRKQGNLEIRARQASMSALVVAAIVGGGAGAALADNLSYITTDAGLAAAGTTTDVGLATGATSNQINAPANGTIKSLYVGTGSGAAGPSLYVGGNYTVTGGKATNGTATTANVYVKQGAIYIGKKVSGTTVAAAPNAKLTVDNMTLDGTGAKLEISNDSTLASKQDITVTQGEIQMKGGTIEFTDVNTGAVVLKSSGAAADAKLTVSSGSNYIKGSLNVHNGTVAITGGTLDVSKTTTVNSGSTVTVAGGAAMTTNTLTMTGGTVTIDQKGSLTVTTLDGASGGTLTVDGSLTTGAKQVLTMPSSVSGSWDFTTANQKAAYSALIVNGDATTGTLYLTGFDANLTYTLADLRTAATELFDNASGNVALIGARLADGEKLATGDAVSAPTQIVGVGKNVAVGAADRVLEVKGLTLDADSASGLSTVADSTLTLIGDGANPALVTKSNIDQDITLGNNADLNLGSASAKGVADKQGGTVGNITTTGDGTISVAVGNFTTGTITTAGGKNIISVADKGTLNAGGITMGAGDRLLVGSNKTTGTLHATNVNLGGGALFLDPAWSEGSSQAGVEFASDTLHGFVAVGQNSMLTMGSTDTTWLKSESDREGGLSENGLKAALGIKKVINVGATDQLLVDGRLRQALEGEKMSGGASAEAGDPIYTDATGNHKAPIAPGSAQIAANTLLVLDTRALGENNAAIKGSGTAGTFTIDSSTKLRLATNSVIGHYTLADNFSGGIAVTNDNAAGTLRDLSKIDVAKTPDRMLYTAVSVNNTTNNASQSLNVDVNRYNATTRFRDMSNEMGTLVNRVYDLKANNVDSPNAGIRFVSRAVNSDYLPNADRVAPTLEGAAQLAVVGATQGMTLSAATAGTTAVTTRTSFASPLTDKTRSVALNMSEGQVKLDEGVSAGDTMKNGLGLWIMPLYQSNNVWGMKSEEFKTGYTSDLGGVALGADYTFAEAFRVGLALNIGGGYAQSQGDFNKTDNSFNFWGINLYGGWSQNNFGITADVGYTGNYNKVSQETDASMHMGDTKADVTSSAVTAGLRGEYKFETDVVDIIPHISVRLTSLTTDEYDAKNNGTVFKADMSNQTLWTFPIGVTFAKSIETESGWTFKPQVDLQVIPAAGDVKAKSKVRIPGIDQSAELKTRIVDDFTYGGGIGLDVMKENVSFGINYNIQASEHSTAHGVFGTFRYEF